MTDQVPAVDPVVDPFAPLDLAPFTVDWFSGNIPTITRTLAQVDQVHRILEIGSFEGKSACWFLDRYPQATLTSVDTFEGSIEHADMDLSDLYDRFVQNTGHFGDRVIVRRGKSRVMLHGLEAESFDVVYIDGSHQAPDVLSDFVLSVGLVRSGGVIMIDDYAQGMFPGVRRVADYVSSVFSETLRCVHTGYQIHFMKTL